MKRVIACGSLLLLLAAGSCTSCESCKGAPGARDGSSPASDAAVAMPTTGDAQVAPQAVTAPTGGPQKISTPPETACKQIARDITLRACNCPQSNQAGCCLLGSAQPDGGTAYVHCSRGRTDWPSQIEARLCEHAKERADALAACNLGRDKAQCATTQAQDRGLRLPKECDVLFGP